MRNNRVIFFAAAVIGLLLVGDASAQQATSPGQSSRDAVATDGEQQDGQPRYFVRASRLVLIGTVIKTAEGEDVGTVEDLLVDAGTGEIGYVVMSASGLVPDNQLAAVPIEVFKVDKEEGVLVMNMSKDVLRGAPSFARNEWPDMAGGDWSQAVDSYYKGRKEAG